MLVINLIYYICIAILFLPFARSQYVSFQQSAPASNMCESSSNTSLVEHFFNLIFSEFHNHPPVCVCVQMCAEQPTYCYPNGCYKKAETRRKADSVSVPQLQVSQLQTDKSKPMSFLVDDQSGFMENLLTTKYVADNKAERKPLHDKDSFQELHRDPFRDRYQSIFKYKKTPKVHLRYNLREQVKHMKSDVIKIEKIDVSKTRWPTVGEKKQFFLETQNEEKAGANPNKFFPAVMLDNGPAQYQSKFFKRDLTKKYAPPPSEDLDVEALIQNKSFSLENLIENLIESSFGPLVNDTELDLNVNLDYNLDNNTVTTVEPITLPSKRSIFDKNTMIIINETTNVMSLNDTNQNLDVNKYTDDTTKGEMYKNIFNDMIASLSKHIEKNNNNSMEMMEQILGRKVYDTTERTESPTPEELRVDITTSDITTRDMMGVETTTTTTTTEVYLETATPKRDDFVVPKKSHQRLARKLVNGKNN